ncbi:MAG: threonine synthase [Lentisphaeria bacterium]|nr:threonine synthase [Lentisphaeria bacterium]
MYLSTRGGIEPVSFRDAVLMGLATDGGLLLPSAIPDATPKLDAWRQLPYAQLAAEVMALFVGDSIPRTALDELTARSYATFRDPEVTPTVQVGPVHILELFHGPTLAFKDVALQFLGNLFEHILEQTGATLNILGATSGDTGSAAIAGVRGKDRINVFIMHPHGRTSAVQERQMTTVLDANVHNIAIDGTFDDGQRVLKEIFNDISFKTEFHLGAVNSVNWARILAQTVYYFHTAFRVCERTGAPAIQACVPTGNFGDVFAGYIACQMGAPIRRLILATNENDILARFFNTGVYRQGEVRPTTSPAMDIQIASNFERYLYYRTGSAPEQVRTLMNQFQREGELRIDGCEEGIVAGVGTHEQTADIIRTYHKQHGYLLDPHTAVGVTVAERFLLNDIPTVCLATAHPAKFGQTIADIVKEDVAHHALIDGLMDLPTRCEFLPAEKSAVQTFMRQTLKRCDLEPRVCKAIS